MSAPLRGASPPTTPTTPTTPPTAPTDHEEMGPRSSPVRSAREMRNWVRTGDPSQDSSPTVPSRGPASQGPPTSLSASGLKYNPQSGMWQKLSLADVAAAAATSARLSFCHMPLCGLYLSPLALRLVGGPWLAGPRLGTVGDES